MKKTRLIILVSKGLVSEVYSDKEVDLDFIDYDCLDDFVHKDKLKYIKKLEKEIKQLKKVY